MKIIHYVRSSIFIKQAIILISGTGLAQLITIGITPILTRVYSPEDFGTIAVFTAIISIGTIIANGRYELAIMLPEKSQEAFNIGKVGLIFCLLTCGILYIIIFFNKTKIDKFLVLDKWIYLIPLAIFFSAFSNLLNYWNNRIQNYRSIARSKIVQSSTTNTIQLIIFSFSTNGLLVGYCIGLFTTNIYLIIDFFKKKSINRIDSDKRNNLLTIAKKYVNFPLFSTWGALFDITATQLPLIIITHFFDSYYSGIYAMATRLINMPLLLLGSALSQILFQRIVTLDANQPNHTKFFLQKTLLTIWLLILPFGIFISLSGDKIFSFVLGDTWTYAGEIAMILTPAVLFCFSVGSLSSVLLLKRNILIGVLWQLLHLITLCVTLWYFQDSHFMNFIYAFATHEVILYSLYLYLIFFSTHQKTGK